MRYVGLRFTSPYALRCRLAWGLIYKISTNLSQKALLYQFSATSFAVLNTCASSKEVILLINATEPFITE